MRDEGKTIAVGKVLKYKPHGSTGAATTESSKTAESKSQINTETKVVDKSEGKDIVFDMDAGEVKEKKKEIESIQEGDEDEDEQ